MGNIIDNYCAVLKARNFLKIGKNKIDIDILIALNNGAATLSFLVKKISNTNNYYNNSYTEALNRLLQQGCIFETFRGRRRLLSITVKGKRFLNRIENTAAKYLEELQQGCK